MKPLLIIIVILVFGSVTNACPILGIEIYSTQIATNTFEFNVTVITTSTPQGGIIMNYTGGEFDELSEAPDTSYLIGCNTYCTKFKFKHTFPGEGTFIVTCKTYGYWSTNIVNIIDAGFSSPEETIIVVNSNSLSQNHFSGFLNNLYDGTIIGNSFSNNNSVIDPDGDLVNIEQINLYGFTGYELPTEPTYSSSQGLAGFFYFCNNIKLPGYYIVSFQINEYRSGILMATHKRNMTFQYGNVGIEENENANNFEIYPNPANEIVEINSANEINLKIIDGLGKVLHQQTYSIGKLDISYLPKGFYLIFIEENNKTTIKRLIKN